MTANLVSYGLRVEPLETVLEKINKGTYECYTCLRPVDDKTSQTIFSKGSEDEAPMAQVFQCEHCLTYTVCPTEEYLGIGNTEELKEYETVYAEWYQDY